MEKQTMYRHGPLFIMAFSFIAVGALACLGIIASDIYNGGSEGWIILGVLGALLSPIVIKDLLDPGGILLEERRIRAAKAYWAKRRLFGQ
jgi:hypothetical protein